jgi:hypothetical protein
LRNVTCIATSDVDRIEVNAVLKLLPIESFNGNTTGIFAGKLIRDGKKCKLKSEASIQRT